MALKDRRLYRACETDFIGLLGAARRFGMAPRVAEDICTVLARLRGIAIERYPATLGGHPSGLALRGPELCLILYERETSLWHQQGIILHECGHLYYGHLGTEVGTLGALQVLMPDLSREQLAAAFPTAAEEEGHGSENERQAEMFATVGLAWLSRTRVPAYRHSAETERAALPDDPAVAVVIRRLLEDFAEGQR